MEFDRQAIFESFDRVRKSGITNMYDARTVCTLAELTKEEYFYIIDNYEELYDEFGTNIAQRYE